MSFERPGFMLLTVLAALAGTAAIGLLAEHAYDPRVAHAEILADADRAARDELVALGLRPVALPAAQSLRAERGVEVLEVARPIEVGLGHGLASAQPPSEVARARGLSIVREELSRYPAGLLARARLYRVVLCEGLREEGTRIPSLPNVQRSLLLDVDATPEFLRRLVHHEVFHFVDYAEDDQVQTDRDWSELAERERVFGSGGRFLRDPAGARLGSGPPGFVTRYATSALEEDKAETFSFLMVAPAALAELSNRDAVLSEKRQRVQRQIQRLWPALGDELWR